MLRPTCAGWMDARLCVRRRIRDSAERVKAVAPGERRAQVPRYIGVVERRHVDRERAAEREAREGSALPPCDDTHELLRQRGPQRLWRGGAAARRGRIVRGAAVGKHFEHERELARRLRSREL